MLLSVDIQNMFFSRTLKKSNLKWVMMVSEFSRKLHTNRQGNPKISSEICLHANRQSFDFLSLKESLFPPHFHLKWSPQRNLLKTTIWYIKASLILLMEYISSIKILLNMVWHIFNYFKHYSPSECQMLLTTAPRWKKRGISGVLHLDRSCKQIEPFSCGLQDFHKLQPSRVFNLRNVGQLIPKKLGICCKPPQRKCSSKGGE